MSNARNLANLLGTGTQITTADIADGAFQANKNLIINGAMQVAQRGTSFANPSDGTYSLDRIHIFNSNDGATTITQDTTVPNGEGFTQSIKFDCTTLDGTIAAGQYLTLNQRIEGYNNAVLGYGASGAKSITVSFYAKSNLTGTFCYSIRNGALNRAYIKEFSLTSADVWERVSFTIPGETSGTWLTTNGIGSIHQISLSVGSTFQGIANQWNSSNVVATSNQVNFLSSTDNEFFLTGWQVEVGDTATPFEHRSYGDELARCQRYYETDMPEGGSDTRYSMNMNTTSSHYTQESFQVTKRAVPTITVNQTYNDDLTVAVSTGTTSRHHAGFALSNGGTINARALAEFNWTADAEL